MRLLLAAAALALFPGGMAPAHAQSPPPAPAAVERTGSLPAELAESSGLALSRRYAGVLWTHNDSGNEPVLYAVRAGGEVIARIRVVGARVVDWEDLALGPCPGNPAGSCLFIGDVGDNPERRTRGVLYVVPEPDPSAAADSVVARAVRVRYLDGPHDIEAVLVGPDGTLDLVTKGRTGGVLRYTLSPEQLLLDSVAVAPRGRLPIEPQPLVGRWVTGGAVSPSGRRVVLRTYTELYFFDRGSDGTWTPAGGCWLGVLEPQGEAVDFLDEDTVFLTSETTAAGAGPIHRVRC